MSRWGVGVELPDGRLSAGSKSLPGKGKGKTDPRAEWVQCPGSVGQEDGG